MILIDLNQVFIAKLMTEIKKTKSLDIDENLIRGLVLDTLRSYIKKYRTKYGQVIVCCDSKHYWRKDFFPLYKANRKKDRDKSPLDWGLIFDSLSKIREELTENFPHKIMHIDGAEADDIIAVICKNTTEDVLIISSDGDFAQLQKYPNVTQFSPKLNQYIDVEDPEKFLKEHIIRGDSGDGIPNVLSNDNVLVIGERQKPISKDKIQKWLDKSPEEFCTTEQMKHNYSRNESLIDFEHIPDELSTRIKDNLVLPRKGNKQKLMTYFMEHRMKELMQDLVDF